jgi:hypothetical protein
VLDSVLALDIEELVELMSVLKLPERLLEERLELLLLKLRDWKWKLIELLL